MKVIGYTLKQVEKFLEKIFGELFPNVPFQVEHLEGRVFRLKWVDGPSTQQVASAIRPLFLGFLRDNPKTQTADRVKPLVERLYFERYFTRENAEVILPAVHANRGRLGLGYWSPGGPFKDAGRIVGEVALDAAQFPGQQPGLSPTLEGLGQPSDFRQWD